ncbi:hypothetical protein SAMN02745671_02436 [Anaerovibrio lipolyticus DSM 3074]|uniref:Uncharacterized protein n=2 Tax=Anaerovibrio lipolyticus TaxID=82374 RepID=A0A0B2JRD5_9FIRM|nr:hypothetical protein [Anaerovibrio lipolyticus]KHM50920.1 hypothetical protein NZ47_11945 [Anaerovibrio lipolyticus]SHJ02400.1 hypothetical protein SAMN02745671_02436 [Anaerovibrio lipolyticus DSM 3074]
MFTNAITKQIKKGIVKKLEEAYVLARKDIAKLRYLSAADDEAEWVCVYDAEGNNLAQIDVTGQNVSGLILDVVHAINDDIVIGGKKK